MSRIAETPTSKPTSQPGRAPLDDWDALGAPDVTRPFPSTTPLADIAAGLAATVSLDLLPAGPGRRYTLLLETPAYEAWLIAWPQGTGLALHDHGSSAAAIAVVRGRLRERYEADHGLRVRWLAEGARVALPEGHVHEVVNVDDQEAVSLHVYGPRLDELGFRTGEREIGA